MRRLPYNLSEISPAMKNKSLIEEILAASLKNPTVGVVMSIILAVVGFFLTHKSAPVAAKPADAMFIPM